MKDASSFYLKHDLDAREDEKLRGMLMKLGAKGYGLYWMIVEDLYRNSGRLKRDYEALSWSLREDQHDIKAVVEDFECFYDDDGRIACRRVDRALAERREAVKIASLAGKASAAARSAQRALNDRSATLQPGEEGEVRRGKEITTASRPPAAFDFSRVRFPYGKDKGVHITELELDRAEMYLKDDRLGAQVRSALLAHVAGKKAERVR